MAGPLEGLRVIDLGRILAAPTAATLLADLGADVIKIEHPDGGDPLRKLGAEKDGTSLWWKANARNKRTIALDLKSDEDRALFLELVGAADVLVENFVPGTLERLDLGYATLQERNARLILLSISGFGQSGPRATNRAFGRTVEAFGGLTYISGFPDRPPINSGMPLADYIGGVFGAMAVLAARCEMLERGHGKGQQIDLALYEAVFRLLEYLPITYQSLGVITERLGNGNAYVAPVGTYETRDGGWASFTGSTQTMVDRLFKAIGRPELVDDERFATASARVSNRDELDEIIAAWIKSHDLGDVCSIFDDNGVAIAPIMSVAEMFKDPHYAARGAIELVEDDDLGTAALVGVVPKFSRTPGAVHFAGHGIDQDRDTILSDWLGRTTKPAEER